MLNMNKVYEETYFYFLQRNLLFFEQNKKSPDYFARVCGDSSCNVISVPADGRHTTLHFGIRRSFRTTGISPVQRGV